MRTKKAVRCLLPSLVVVIITYLLFGHNGCLLSVFQALKADPLNPILCTAAVFTINYIVGFFSFSIYHYRLSRADHFISLLQANLRNFYTSVMMDLATPSAFLPPIESHQRDHGRSLNRPRWWRKRRWCCDSRRHWRTGVRKDGRTCGMRNSRTCGRRGWWQLSRLSVNCTGKTS